MLWFALPAWAQVAIWANRIVPMRLYRRGRRGAIGIPTRRICGWAVRWRRILGRCGSDEYIKDHLAARLITGAPSPDMGFLDGL